VTISGGKQAPFWAGGIVVLILVAILFTRALYSPDPSREVAFAVKDSAGVEVVESFQPVWEEGEGWRVGHGPQLRIGAMDGEAAYQFTQITGLGLLPDGGVVVGDGGSQEIRFFDGEGQHVRTVGRPGEGPGEFTGLSMTGVDSGGEVWAYDFSLRRLTWFDAQGEIKRLISLAMDPPTLNAVGPLSDGTFVLKQLWGASQVSQATNEGFRRDPVAWVSFDNEGALVDSVGAFPGRELFLWDDNGRGVMSTPPFGRNSSGTLRGDRVVVGDQALFELQELSASGDLLRILRIPGKVEEVTPAALEAYIQSRLVGAPPEQHPSIRQSLEEMPAPDTKPAYGGMLSDATGCLWVSEWTYSPEFPSYWTIFNEGGQWLGEVEVPERFYPWVIGEDWILGVEQDELDVEYVVLYPLERR
jgi:hypothetical protein